MSTPGGITATHDIQISGTAEPRKVRAEIRGNRGTIGKSPWITLGAGERREVQITLTAPAGTYGAVQVTNTGSNIHEDNVEIGLGEVKHS